MQFVGTLFAIFAVCHVLPMVLAVFFLKRRNFWFSAAATATLVSEIVGFPLAHTVSREGMFGAAFDWWLLGPLYVPYILPAAIEGAPVWVMALLGAGAIASVAGWCAFLKRLKPEALVRRW